MLFRSIDRAGSSPVARQNDIQFYIVNDSLTLSDFLKEEQEQREVIPLSKLTTYLKKRLPVSAVEKYDTKKQYLRRLYAALRGRSDAVSEREAVNAARTFSRFMAYKPVKSINGFVANEILEEKDLGDAIRTVSDLMKTIYSMEAEANSLAATIQVLNNTKGAADKYIQQWIDFNSLAYTAAKARFNYDQKSYLKAKEKQQKIREDLQQAEQGREQAQEKRKQLREIGRASCRERV